MTVARSPSQVLGFAPADRPRVAIATDGTLAAIQESTRIVVVEIPGGAPFAELRVDAEAGEVEVAWVGAPPRLLVLSRYAAHSTVHLLDPYGPRTIAEIRLESPMKLCATVGAHALAVGSLGAAVLTASETHLMPYQFPARAVPTAAGAAAGHFVVALAGSIEEWDPHSRMPKRRLRLPRPVQITAVGGSDRVIWMTTTQDPARIDVMPLGNRGQPKQHDLPEPIAHASGHPRSDLLACIGADSGRLYIVDLDGRARLRVIGPEGIDRIEAAGLVVGRIVGVLAAQAKRPISIIPLDDRPEHTTPPPLADLSPAADTSPVAKSTLGADDEDDDKHGRGVDGPPTGVTLSSPPLAQSAPARPRTPPTPPPTSGRSPFRHPTSAPPANRAMSSTASAGMPVATDAPSSWRDDVIGWYRAVVSGLAERGSPPAPAIEALALRCELPVLAPALALLYGAHLAGERGAAPIDVARVLGRRWDEALGKGELAARGLAIYTDSRVRLAPIVQAALDELPAITGTLCGELGTIALLGPAAIVAETGELSELATACRSIVGSTILVARAGVAVDDVFSEARVRGAVPMLRLANHTLARMPTGPAIFVVADANMVDQLGLPRLA